MGRSAQSQLLHLKPRLYSSTPTRHSNLLTISPLPLKSFLLKTPSCLPRTQVQTHITHSISSIMPPKVPIKKPRPPPKPLPTDLPIHSFPSATHFETFLDQNHSTCAGFHLKLAKKASGIASVSSSEAVEIALCFGWIDGRANALDEKHWLVRYTPRRAKSLWSAKNVGTVQKLIESGKMRPAGLDAVEAAKRDGRWDRAYDGPANIEVPKDLEAALEADEKVKAVFEGLNRTERYWVLHRLQTGAVSKRAEKVKGVVGMLARGEVSVPNGKGKDNEKSFKVEKKVKKVKKGKVERPAVVKVSQGVGESTRQLRSRNPRQ